MDTKQTKQGTSCYCLKVRKANGAVTKFYDTILAPSGVTTRQYSLLLNISRAENISIRELADMSELDRSTLARNLKPLFNKELVSDAREIGTRDCKLILTEKGKTVLSEAAALWAKAQQMLMEKVGYANLDMLDNVLEMLEKL